MNLKTITITGADESVDPGELVRLSQEYPFVEWGILLSSSSMGERRFPSYDWLEKLQELRKNPMLNHCVSLSGHLCGKWVRDVLIGKTGDLSMSLNGLEYMFGRIQINTHGISEKKDLYAFCRVVEMLNRAVLIQMDGENDGMYKYLRQQDCDIYPFFDLSHGCGVLPESWPRPMNRRYGGYGGGLGPDNLEKQLERIAAIVGSRPFWVDMETKVRSDDDKQFDLNKVVACLEIGKKHIKQKRERLKGRKYE